MTQSIAPMSIPELVAELNQLSNNNFSEGSGFSDAASSRRFTQITEKLGILARDPAENVYYAGCRTAQNSAIRCAIGLGLFEIIPDGEVVSMKELSSKVQADSILVERILRALVVCNVFDEAGQGLYKHNELSRCFIKKSNRDMFHQMYDFVGKGVFAMADYLEKTGWKNPEGYEDAAISFALGIKDGYWEYLAAKPERQALFNSGMQSRPAAISVAALYPFDKELNREPIEDNEVALVDIGGGRGHALIEVRDAFPHLKGRFILQDQAGVVADAKEKGLPSYIEAQAASFFEPNPVKNARAYYYRRVFHDWSDPISVKILSNTVDAMGPHSRVLIADNAMPVQSAPWSMALQDINMMALGGIERTEEQWRSLLRKAGLTLTRVWKVEDSNHVVIEARKA